MAYTLSLYLWNQIFSKAQFNYVITFEIKRNFILICLTGNISQGNGQLKIVLKDVNENSNTNNNSTGDNVPTISTEYLMFGTCLPVTIISHNNNNSERFNTTLNNSNQDDNNNSKKFTKKLKPDNWICTVVKTTLMDLATGEVISDDVITNINNTANSVANNTGNNTTNSTRKPPFYIQSLTQIGRQEFCLKVIFNFFRQQKIWFKNIFMPLRNMVEIEVDKIKIKTFTYIFFSIILPMETVHRLHLRFDTIHLHACKHSHWMHLNSSCRQHCLIFRELLHWSGTRRLNTKTIVARISATPICWGNLFRQ